MAVSIALNEVYIGKTPNLIKAEKLLGDIKKEYNEKWLSGKKIMADPRWREISDLIGNQFGLERLWIELYSDQMINACTLPITYGIECAPIVRLRKNLIVDEKGFKFKPSAEYVINIMTFTGLVLNPMLTAGEVIAILLHEIGHNFQNVIDDKCFYTADLLYLTYMARVVMGCLSDEKNTGVDVAINVLYAPVVGSQAYRKLSIKITEALSKYDAVRTAYAMYDCITGLIRDTQMNLDYILICVCSLANFPAMAFNKVVRNLVNTALSPMDYRHEKIADNFATMYGYGQELTSALLKMEINFSDQFAVQKILNKIPVFGTLVRQVFDANFFVAGILDCHPTTIERCYDQIRYLKAEINSNKYISDQEKARLNNQATEIENNIKYVLANPNLDKQWGVFSYLCALMMSANKGDIRRHFDSDIHASIQKTYDRAIKNMK